MKTSHPLGACANALSLAVSPENTPKTNAK
jgi:hypothetical protein